jgi:gluconokinase
MATGHPLSDAERWPWLEVVGRYLSEARKNERGAVMACSALKRSYRDLLRSHVPDLFFVFLDGPMAIVHERINSRNHEFMPPTLLASQYLSLEPLTLDERGVRVDITESPESIVTTIGKALAAEGASTTLRDR